MIAISVLILILFYFTNSLIRGFPGIGIEMVNQSINQPFLLSIAVIEFSIILIFCSSTIFRTIRANKIARFCPRFGAVLFILTFSIVEAMRNPYFLFYNCAPLFILMAVNCAIGYLLSKKNKNDDIS